MKLTTLFLLLISFSSFGQTLYLVPAELLDMAKESKVGPGLIQLKALNKTLDTVIYADGNHYYLISSADGNNAPGTKIRVNITQVTLTTQPPVTHDTIRTVVTEIIDDSDPRNVLTGAMLKATNNVTANGFYQMTLTFRNNLNLPAKVTFKFTGDGFVWMGERRSTHGSVNVIVDGISTLVLCNEPLPKVQGNDKELFRKEGLKNDMDHTVEIVPVGTSQFVHDRFVTFKTNITVVQR